jgi:uncharacterized membrane protein
MFRRLLTAKLARPDGFVHRGHEVTRLEAFSDAAFGFVVTLLVVSLEVPNSFDELMDRMSGFVAFAACFALLVHFWFKHFHFFRRFGLQDVTTIIINSALLFVLLLYVYPLKFLFLIFVKSFLGIGPDSVVAGSQSMTVTQFRMLFALYGFGFFIIYALFGALYLHAYRLRHQLKLSRLEAFDTLAAVEHNIAMASCGMISVILSQVLPNRLIGFAGWAYMIVGPVAAIVGMRSGRRRRLIEQV